PPTLAPLSLHDALPICAIAFEAGAIVAKGDLLVRLDTSSEEAQLRAMEAQAELARITLERERTLRNEKMISQSELDSAASARARSEEHTSELQSRGHLV